MVHGNLNRLQNAIRTVKGLQLEVDDIVFNGLASSLAVLSNEQKEMGSLVIDIGGGTTDYVVYANGIIKHTGVLAVGGDHVSNDLAYGLKVPLSRAEQLKIEHGSALVEEADKGQQITISNELGMPLKVISRENLRRIMSLRLEEIFALIAQDIAGRGSPGTGSSRRSRVERSRASSRRTSLRRSSPACTCGPRRSSGGAGYSESGCR
jgi:cell division protein FtsA